ncbi:DUF2806 domain-containing protein [Stella sp.]|uniref:DUF2806 domain-containing protein n=1 Tax=Stella sp. TaxID=2912054 RepID=UPI0035ADE22B
MTDEPAEDAAPAPPRAEPPARARHRRFVDIVGPLLGMVDEAGDSVPADRQPDRFQSAWDRRRRRTLLAIGAEARRRLSGRIGDGRPSPMWLDRFLESAADAHDPAVQAVYAEMLATEALRPGTVSLAALQRLRAMDAGELARFAKLAQFAIGNFVVRLKESFYEKFGLDGEDLFHFEESGLLRPGGSNVKQFPSQLEDRFQTHLLLADRVLRVSAAEPDRKLVLPCYRLSAAGTDIAEAMALPVVNDYIGQIVELLEKRGYTVAHASIVERGDRNTVARHSRFSEVVSFDRARKGRRR